MVKQGYIYPRLKELAKFSVMSLTDGATNQRMNTIEVERLVQRIHDARQVVFLTSSVGAMSVTQFQYSMIFQNKVIRIVSDMYENIDFVKRLQKQDLLLVISGSGLFAAASRDYLKGNEAYKVLFTLNRSHDFDDIYDRIYHLSAVDRSQEAKSVYFTYGRGPKGEIWKIEDAIHPLVKRCSELLSDHPLFFLINSYTTGLAPAVLAYMLSIEIGKKYGGKVRAEELGLPVTETGLVLPCGASGRWEA